ncbi:MAG: penicillin acylase family protein, partial [Sphingomonas sp.]|nr:penicillin acylase family protein [Sphingomonas sp.]
LNAYGASTWGQFFIYQGFNADIGWMHTSSGVDNVDEFAETVERRGGKLFYRYGGQYRPVRTIPITVRFRETDGSFDTRIVTTYRTHHGPIVAQRDGKLIAEALMWRPIPALEQSWLRTKTHDLRSYLAVAALQANSSNDTLLADRKGEIAYLHPQFVPVRDDSFDFTRPVDDADPATDWKGLHSLSSLPQAVNPGVGWVKNTNDWPWSAAGSDSPKAKDFPRYMDEVGENWRGVHADDLLKGASGWTPQSLTKAAFDSRLPAFALLIPQLIGAYDALPDADSRKALLAGPIALLRGWDDRWSLDSEATTLAIFWGDTLWPEVGAFAKAERMNVPDYIGKRVSPEAKLAALVKAKDRLVRDFGAWRVKWGEVNRFQRLDD